MANVVLFFCIIISLVLWIEVIINLIKKENDVGTIMTTLYCTGMTLLYYFTFYKMT